MFPVPPGAHCLAARWVQYGLYLSDLKIHPKIERIGRICRSLLPPLLVVPLAEEGQDLRRDDTHVTWVIKEIVMPGVWNRDAYYCAVLADPIQLLHQFQKDPLISAEVLKRMVKHHFVSTVIRPWPRQLFKVDNLVRGTCFEHIDVHIPRQFILASAHVELHVFPFLCHS